MSKLRNLKKRKLQLKVRITCMNKVKMRKILLQKWSLLQPKLSAKNLKKSIIKRSTIKKPFLLKPMSQNHHKLKPPPSSLTLKKLLLLLKRPSPLIQKLVKTPKPKLLNPQPPNKRTQRSQSSLLLLQHLLPQQPASPLLHLSSLSLQCPPQLFTPRPCHQTVLHLKRTLKSKLIHRPCQPNPQVYQKLASLMTQR